MLRLAPKDFWRATPAEIAAAARGISGAASSVPPLSRAELERLAARYPDIEEAADGRG